MSNINSLQRYKIGYSTDDWGMRSSSPSALPDPNGQLVLFSDVQKLLSKTEPAVCLPPGEWSLGAIEGNWRDIDHTNHGGVIRIVWAMEEDGNTPNPELQAQAQAVVDALNAHTKSANQCAQCKKAYKHSATVEGCPKCAPGLVVQEAEFRQPLAQQAAPAVPDGDELRKIARSAQTSASDPASPCELVLAGWRAALAAQGDA